MALVSPPTLDSSSTSDRRTGIDAERDRALAALERRNAELEHCVHSLAHDLRSPLVALLGFSRLLRDDYGAALDAAGLRFVERIEQAGRTMEELIRDVLELASIGQREERPTVLDPRGVLVQIAAELKPQLEQSGTELLLPDSPPPVYCDRTRLYQLFSNLIGNALEHMGTCAERRIEVAIEATDDLHHIRVRDTGCGIETDQHERIFEPFQSLNGRRDGRRASGMGLAIVRRVAETRGGNAWVESTPGAGACFHVTLRQPECSE